MYIKYRRRVFFYIDNLVNLFVSFISIIMLTVFHVSGPNVNTSTYFLKKKQLSLFIT